MKHANDNAPTKGAYYNEFDPYAAQWLRNLIKAGHIADGEVDERSIADVHADDLKGFTQCHFFAGIGGWSLAARLAGWPDELPLWTGSCPCQPFSVAGKGKGQDDERHLWPAFFDLIKARRPPVVMGEQVAAAVGKSWLDGVFTDLESIGYATGAAVVPACAVNAPHRRDRLWFVADNLGNSQHDGQSASAFRGCDAQAVQHNSQGQDSSKQFTGASASGNVSSSIMADTTSGGRDEGQSDDTRMHQRVEAQGSAGRFALNGNGYSNVANTECGGQPRQGQLARSVNSTASCNGQADRADDDSSGTFWHGAEYIAGPDGKARRIEPSIRLLAHGVPARVGALKAYGNAIVPQVAAEIIKSYMDCSPHHFQETHLAA